MFSGDLKKLPLADVFQNIHQNGLTGALAIRPKKGIERMVSFESGFVTGATGTGNEEKDLAGELVRQRVIKTDDIGRPSRFFKRKGSLKRSLKRRKILDSGEFTSFAKSVMLERIYDCFLLEEGTYEFLEDYDKTKFDDDEDSAGVKIAPGEILMEAMRRIDEFKRIRRAIPSTKEVYIATRAANDEDNALEQEILSLTAGGTTNLEGVLDSLPTGRFNAFEAVLTMVESGSLRVATAPEYLDLGKAAEERGDMEAAADYYGRGLEYERGNSVLNIRRIDVLEALQRHSDAAKERKLYGGLLLEQGDNKGAQDQYKRAAELAPSDPFPLEKLLDMQVDQDKDYLGGRETAQKLVKLYTKLGLGDNAKSVFPRLLLLKPKDRWLRERMAETHVELHENATAGQIYKELAQEALDEGDNAECAVLLRKAVEFLPDDDKAKTLLEEIESGTLAVKRRRRRILRAVGAVLFVLGLAAFWGSYEVLALVDLRNKTRDIAQTPDRSCKGLLAAQEKLAATAKGYPFSQASAWSEELREAIAREYANEACHLHQTFQIGPKAKDPLSSKEVFQTLDDLLGAPGKPERLKERLAAAEKLLDEGKQKEAHQILTQEQKAIDKAIQAINRADAETRGFDRFTASVNDMTKLLPRVYLAWGRANFDLKRAQDVLAQATKDLLASEKKRELAKDGGAKTEDKRSKK